MVDAWAASRAAFEDAARWFARTVMLVDGRWDQPALGEWDVRALVGHTSRALLNVETYLSRPAEAVEIESAADYFRAARPIAASPEVADRGRAAGSALGDDPVGSVFGIADRVINLVDECDGSELMTTIVGGMRLADYLPTRVFELTVHTADLCVALGVTPRLPDSATRVALSLVADLASGDALAVLFALTGRTRLPAGFSLL